MIRYDEKFNETILSLREILIDNNFDLLVQNLKLPTYYFQEPGFAHFGHSINARLKQLGLKSELLIRLFCLGELVELELLSKHLLSEEIINNLVEMGLFLNKDGSISTDHYSIYPFLGCHLIGTLGTARSIGAYISRQSYTLAANMLTDDYESLLDLGSGCGLLSIIAAMHCNTKVVDGIEIIAEGVDVAKTNAVLNIVSDRVNFYNGNMYEPVKERGAYYDAIVSHPPYMAIPNRYSDLISISSGEDGLGFMRQLLNGIDEFKPRIVKLVANSLGNEKEPLLIPLLKESALDAQGYQAKLMITSKGMIDDTYILRLVKIVEDAYCKKGEQVPKDRIMSEFKFLYKQLGFNYYYGMSLNLEKTLNKGEPFLEILEIPNKYDLNMAPCLLKDVKIEDYTYYLAQLDNTKITVNEKERLLLDSLLNNGVVNDVDKLRLAEELEYVFGFESVDEEIY